MGVISLRRSDIPSDLGAGERAHITRNMGPREPTSLGREGTKVWGAYITTTLVMRANVATCILTNLEVKLDIHTVFIH